MLIRLARLMIGIAALALPAAAHERNEGAWRVECGGDGKTLDCRAVQAAQHREGQPLLAAMAVRWPAETKKPAITLQLPLGIQLGEPVTLRVDEGATEKFMIQTCNAAGCFVQAPLPDATVAALRAGKLLHIGFRDAAKQPATATMVLLGFGLAVDKAK